MVYVIHITTYWLLHSLTSVAAGAFWVLEHQTNGMEGLSPRAELERDQPQIAWKNSYFLTPVFLIQI